MPQLGLCTGFKNKNRLLKDTQLFSAFQKRGFYIILKHIEKMRSVSIKKPVHNPSHNLIF